MIVGIVGTGKSALLKAIIGELKCRVGKIECDSANIAYCAQTPWLPNLTVRQIVCGYQFELTEDKEWYDTVVHACAFGEDIQLLPDRDETMVGSRGVTLSGDQKQRLALARAIYSRLSIVVLNDVFSAIDVRIEKLVGERLLGKTGLLRKLHSTVVLTTYAVTGAGGQIAEQGIFETPRAETGLASKLLLDRELLKSSSGLDAEPTKMGGMKRSTIAKAIPSATANDIADMTRRTGDIAVCQAFPLYTILRNIDGVCNYHGTMVSDHLRIKLLMLVTPRSGVGLHRSLLKSVIRAPQSFFDKTDSGITLNRFSQDMILVDGPLSHTAALSMQNVMELLA
ncbi:P-loop containing nucleoside triphosphate hydrolase protein [Bisporella sp. PMI_857]|nr:P-loop containing nucleoside triphosphate hydrolase protein [Bisporella sp. PMI_857]